MSTARSIGPRATGTQVGAPPQGAPIRPLLSNLYLRRFVLGYRAVDRHARKRLRQWWYAKHKVHWPGTKQFSEASLYDRLGRVCLPRQTVHLPWAKA